jgi:hypothetical protein
MSLPVLAVFASCASLASRDSVPACASRSLKGSDAADAKRSEEAGRWKEPSAPAERPLKEKKNLQRLTLARSARSGECMDYSLTEAAAPELVSKIRVGITLQVPWSLRGRLLNLARSRGESMAETARQLLEAGLAATEGTR